MLLPVIALCLPICLIALYRYLARKHAARALWRSSLTVSVTVGLLRGVLAGVGWYVVEHTGGPLQIPAFVLAMLAWPEAVVLGRHQGPTPMRFYPVLALLLLVTSTLLVIGVALTVQVTHGRRDA